MLLQIRRSIQFLGTEIFSPFILAGCLLLAVPAMFAPDWGWQAAVGLLSVVAIPWGLSLWMSHTGRTTDKFIYHRRQRYGFYGLSLLSMAAGAITLLVTPSALEVKAIIVALFAAVAAITLVNFRLKASAHACMSAIFAVVIPGVLGPWWAVATIAVHAVVCWSRWAMKKHTILELVVGTLLGAGAGALYLLYI